MVHLRGRILASGPSVCPPGRDLLDGDGDGVEQGRPAAGQRRRCALHPQQNLPGRRVEVGCHWCPAAPVTGGATGWAPAACAAARKQHTVCRFPRRWPCRGDKGWPARRSGRRGARRACGRPTCPPHRMESARTTVGRGGASGLAAAAFTSSRSCCMPRHWPWRGRSGQPARRSGGCGARKAKACGHPA